MSEIDYISIDNFQDKNLKSYAFFLSHCHTDHMKGLDSRDFEMCLRQNNAYLYTSYVSGPILEKRYPNLKPWIKQLDMYSKNIIDIPILNKTLVVSLISAAHCPGSVMFLFEADKTVLYTGDIRIRAKELEKCKLLYDSAGLLKKIDNIYLDTTFFMKSYNFFPSRLDSVNTICKLIFDWLEKNSQNQISFLTPAKYGYEYLFMEISKQCGMPVHVDLDKYNVYNCFPEMDNVITLDAGKTKIHNYCNGFGKEICVEKKEYILKIKPCAFSWQNCDFTSGLVRNFDDGIRKVCYSTHASYNEIMDILNLLKPVKISPCVVPKDIKEEQEMDKLIEQVLNDLNKKEEEVNNENKSLFINKTDWSANKCESSPIKETHLNENCEENSDIFNIMDSPEFKRKKFT